MFTPVLRDQIEALAQTDTRHPYRENYEALKTNFAQFYQISERDFTWQTFHTLLSSYNPFDVQIILGPVLRMFLRDVMSRQDRETLDTLSSLMIENPDMDPQMFIDSLTEILPPDGRYESLSPEETYLFLAKPLGFNLTYHKDGQDRTIGEEDSDHNTRLAHITIQHSGGAAGACAGGHWELYVADNERVDYEKEANTQLAGHIPLLGNDIRVTPTAIACLKQHVLLTYRRLIYGEDSADTLRELALTVAQIEKFLFNINHVEKNLANRLLGARVTQAAELFIDSFQVSDIQYYPAFNQLITYKLDGNIQFPPPPPATAADVGLNIAQDHLVLTLLDPAVILTHANRLSNSEPQEAPRRSRLLIADEVSPRLTAVALVQVSATSAAPDTQQAMTAAIPNTITSSDGSTGFLIDLICWTNSTGSKFLQGAILLAALALVCTGVGGLVGCVVCATALIAMSLSSTAAIAIGAGVCGFFAVAKSICVLADDPANTSLNIQCSRRS